MAAGVALIARARGIMKKIAFWRTVGDAYGFLYNHAARFFVLSVGLSIAIILTVVVTVLASLVSWVLAYAVVILGAALFYFTGILAFAVALHRAIRSTSRRGCRFISGAANGAFSAIRC